MTDLPNGGAAKDGGSLADQVHDSLKRQGLDGSGNPVSTGTAQAD